MTVAATTVSLTSIKTTRKSTSTVMLATKTPATILSTMTTKETTLIVTKRNSKTKSIDGYLRISSVNNIWVKVLKNGPSKIFGRQFYLKKNESDMVCLSRPYHFKFFKGCLPQISLGSLLNTLSQICGQSKAFPLSKTS